MTLDPPDLAADLEAVRGATRGLLALVRRTPDLGAPSLLPGWTRAHVVAHVAGNARSHVRMLSGLEQYDGGSPARAEAIERLAADPAAAVEALSASAVELEQAWATADWPAPVRTARRPRGGSGAALDRREPSGRSDEGPRIAAGLVWSRWREVEVHAVDLAAGYAPTDWSAPFLDRLLDELVNRPDLPHLGGVHGPPVALAAWLSGRSRGERLSGTLPDLPAWR